MIGDPSGKNVTRPPLSREEIDANAETYKTQMFKLLDPEKTELRFNGEWMDKFTAADFVRLCAKTTVKTDPRTRRFYKANGRGKADLAPRAACIRWCRGTIRSP